MAITVTERGGRENQIASDGRTARRGFDCLTTASENDQEVRTATGIPQINESHDQETGLLVKRQRIKQIQSSPLWRVEIFYERPEDGGQHTDGDEEEDPLRRRTKYQWEQINHDLPVDRDFHGNPIVNSAGQGFTPPPRRTIHSIKLTATKNRSTFNAGFWSGYINTVNADTFFGAKPEEAFCVEIAPTSVFTKDSSWIETAYKFEFRDSAAWGEKPFQLRILDQGPMALGYAEGEGENRLFAIYDADNRQVRSALLNGKGNPAKDSLRIGNPAKSPAAAKLPISVGKEEYRRDGSGPIQAVWLRYRLYKARYFASLGVE